MSTTAQPAAGTELTVIVVPEDATDVRLAEKLAVDFNAQGLIKDHAVIVDMRLAKSTSASFAQVIASRLAGFLPERLVLLAMDARAERAVDMIEMRDPRLLALCERSALISCPHRDDLVTDLPGHSPLDESLFELFMQCELA